MKTLVFAFCLSLSYQAFGESMADVHKKHRMQNHEEKKKWDQLQASCRERYPKWIDSTHSDYDGHFKCSEEIQDLRTAFRDRQQAEICEKFNVSCNRSPSSLR